MVRLVKLLAGWKPHFCYAQQLLAERMITIVSHFCTQVVKFIFGGRNSGQGETEVIARLCHRVATTFPKTYRLIDG